MVRKVHLVQRSNLFLQLSEQDDAQSNQTKSESGTSKGERYIRYVKKLFKFV